MALSREENTMLDQKVAVVTGAGHPRGIGFAIARKLAADGARVVLSDLASTADELEKCAAELRQAGSDARTCTMDVSDAAEVRETLDRVAAEMRGLDILVNNAGIGGGSSQLLEVEPADFSRTMNVNLLGAFHCCQVAVPHMLVAGEGAIVNIASLCGLGAIPEIPIAYTSSKFAVVGFTKAVALEFADRNIRCNAVCPGAINTAMRDTLFQRMAEEHGISVDEARQMEDETIGMARGGEPEEIADCVAYLAGPSASYVTGTAIPVAGGMVPGL